MRPTHEAGIRPEVVAGPFGDVLKIRPPLVLSEGDAEWLVCALDESLPALGRSRAAPAGGVGLGC